MDVTIVPYKLPDSVPTPKSECGWIAIYEGEAIGWNSLIFESHDTIKFANAYVKEEYRGKGIYTKLWNARMEFCKQNLKGWNVVTYCFPSTYGFYKSKGWEEVRTSTLFKSKIQ